MTTPFVESREFGKSSSGEIISEFTLTNSLGAAAKIITLGGIIRELWMPDRTGELGDVVLGFESSAAYVTNPPYFGALIGRVANRTMNGSFTLAGKKFTLAINNGPNHLHGGLKGFDKVVWKAAPLPCSDGVAILLEYLSPDGDEGYPGSVLVKVIYTLTNLNALRIEYSATTDRSTPINLTQHSYFNLATPKAAQTILQHEMQLFSKSYTPVDDTQIPTGEIVPVAGTPFDFRTPHTIGERIEQTEGGYDHNYVLREPGTPALLTKAAEVYDPLSGRVMTVETTEPGIQFYAGNFLDGTLAGKHGVRYPKRSGFCLEAQRFPNAINEKNFDSPILEPSQTYSQTTIYSFSVR